MFEKKRRRIIEVGLVNKDNEGMTNSIQFDGNRQDLFCATANIVTSLIVSKRLSVEEVVCAFKVGIEEAGKIRKE